LFNAKTLSIETSILILTSEVDLEFVKNYVSHYEQEVIYSIADVNFKDYNAIVIDALQFNYFDELKGSGLKIISLSPLFEFNNNVDWVISRGIINSKYPKTLSNVKYAIFKNLIVLNNSSKPRLVYHIGGGSQKSQILSDINIAITDLISETDTQQICFFEDHENRKTIDYHPFEDFKFQKTDIIITTGGLSLFEAVYSGLRTLNFYISPSHAKVAGLDARLYDNLYECGVLGVRIEQIHLPRVTQLQIQEPMQCMGAIHVLSEIKRIVKDE
jgi:hypothetical protein